MPRTARSLRLAPLLLALWGVAVASPPAPAPDPAVAPASAPASAPTSAPASAAAAAAPTTCTYRTYSWSVKTKKAVGHSQVAKAYAEVTDDERDPADPRCTVCQEDQVAVAVPGLPPVTVCRHWAPQVEAALQAVHTGGAFTIERLDGYRPGRTRGAVKDHLRTAWSNHSFGTAIDINAHHNGLYNPCKLSDPPTTAAQIAHCRKGMGGAWNPQARPKLTIVPGGEVHTAFTAFWKWGGALPGNLKDFMHFSITGE